LTVCLRLLLLGAPGRHPVLTGTNLGRLRYNKGYAVCTGGEGAAAPRRCDRLAGEGCGRRARCWARWRPTRGTRPHTRSWRLGTRCAAVGLAGALPSAAAPALTCRSASQLLMRRNSVYIAFILGGALRRAGAPALPACAAAPHSHDAAQQALSFDARSSRLSVVQSAPSAHAADAGQEQCCVWRAGSQQGL